MDIFSYFRKKGIDTLDVSFYRKIEEWKSWYNANARNFHSTVCIQGAGRISVARENHSAWRRSYRRISQICC